MQVLNPITATGATLTGLNVGELVITSTGGLLTTIPTSSISATASTSLQKSVTQASHGFSVGNVVRSSGVAGQYAKAQADTASNAEVVGIVSVVTDGSNFTLLTGGALTTGVPAATAGTVVFLDPSTAGAMTTTEPSTVGQISRPVGVITTSGAEMYVFPYRGYVVSSIITPPADTSSLLLVMSSSFGGF
jgi:hypothetical protein